MNRILRAALSRLVESGDLTIIDARGRRDRFGDGTGEPVAARITDRATEYKLFANPELAFGEAYMDGRIVMEHGSVYDLIDILMRQDRARVMPALIAVRRGLRFLRRRLDQLNVGLRARRNVAHHYDLDGRLYDLFLDEDRQYSCAYFEDPQTSLEEAQLAKKRHIAAKLDIRPGQRVLDIGSGWGGLALYIAERFGAEVVGITLSEEQLNLSRRRAAERDLSNRVSFELADYRSLEGPFDRIVSVGMFEHVGIGYYHTYFEKVRDLLTEDGIALIHTIGRNAPPGSTSPWIAKYIFPGGYIPALSEVMEAIEPTGLYVSDIEVLRLHYAETIRHWRDRFEANRDAARDLYDERFCRMWEFYLAGSEMSFRRDGMVNFQLQLSKKVDTLPITRTYMETVEQQLRLKDAAILEVGRAAE
ncbi:SAM-dependent methyltransferase [Lutibaculum baratangense]|uniref:Cyclopropane-fatty-acyl-phospholipid synthase n=1 Tax=Lutibaculum baratangense AMV1 TaxID=631454 RepID=V4RK35_9HYPH|nr:cyclopropane-fatty-acyl-phospholipid synthase family protein [Lutibaculum baratangense]ESR23620.1 Cyclopropane-fatty-acyl-phospholipid synthase [Lutibaculum baratangense AMV1]